MEYFSMDTFHHICVMCFLVFQKFASLYRLNCYYVCYNTCSFCCILSFKRTDQLMFAKKKGIAFISNNSLGKLSAVFFYDIIFGIIYKNVHSVQYYDHLLTLLNSYGQFWIRVVNKYVYTCIYLSFFNKEEETKYVKAVNSYTYFSAHFSSPSYNIFSFNY